MYGESVYMFSTNQGVCEVSQALPAHLGRAQASNAFLHLNIEITHSEKQQNKIDKTKAEYIHLQSE